MHSQVEQFNSLVDTTRIATPILFSFLPQFDKFQLSELYKAELTTTSSTATTTTTEAPVATTSGSTSTTATTPATTTSKRGVHLPLGDLHLDCIALELLV